MCNKTDENPEAVTYIENAIKGFQLYQMLYYADEFLEDDISREIYRNIKVSDVNNALLQLSHFRLYLKYYKNAVMNDSNLEKVRIDEGVVVDELPTNDNDYLITCNSCMVLNERFDDAKMDTIMTYIALKTQNDIDKHIEQQNIQKLFGICYNISVQKLINMEQKHIPLVRVQKSKG
jgi:hypothetical protein